MNDFASHTNITWNGNGVGVAEYGGGDKNQVAMFYNRAVHSPAKSNAEGRQIYEDQVYVRIQQPGERLNVVDRPMQPTDQKRFPQQWQQFQQNRQQAPDGTPIDMLYPDQPSIAAMLRGNGVQTVEQCAELTAHAIETIGMGAQRYVNDSQKYLEISNKGVKASQMRHELEERDREIRTLKKMVEDLKGALNDVKAQSANAPNLETIQAMLAGAMGRPQHMPNVPFDSQTAMINSTNQATRSQPVTKPSLKAAPKRQRPKLKV